MNLIEILNKNIVNNENIKNVFGSVIKIIESSFDEPTQKLFKGHLDEVKESVISLDKNEFNENILNSYRELVELECKETIKLIKLNLYDLMK